MQYSSALLLLTTTRTCNVRHTLPLHTEPQLSKLPYHRLPYGNRLNVLICRANGPSAPTIVAAVTGSMRKPVQIQETWNPNTAPTTGTLVLYNADRLDRQEQRDLLAWLDATHGTVRVVSVSARPIFPLVTQGVFLDTLYYRLNMMLVDAAGADAE
jgi:hypothetical protein